MLVCVFLVTLKANVKKKKKGAGVHKEFKRTGKKLMSQTSKTELSDLSKILLSIYRRGSKVLKNASKSQLFHRFLLNYFKITDK